MVIHGDAWCSYHPYDLCAMAQRISESFVLGTTIGQYDQRKPFTLEPSWFARGAVIVGTPGVGKSHDIALIARNLGNTGVAVVILDRTGEHAKALSNLPYCTVYTPGENLPISLLEADHGWADDEVVESAIDMLSHYVQVSFPEGRSLTASQEKILGNCVQKLLEATPKGKIPRITDLMKIVREYHEPQAYQGLIESRESVISRLRPLTVGASRMVFDSEESLSFETFFGPGIHVIELSALRFEQPKNLVSQIVIKRLYHMAKEKGVSDDLRQLLIVDEAHHIAPDRRDYTSFLDSIMIENRKYGQGILVATTSPAQLSMSLLRNASILVSHLLNDGEDINLMLRLMVNEDEWDLFRSYFMELNMGEAMVRVSTPEHVPKTKVKVSE